LALAAQYNLKMHQFDVKKINKNGYFNEDIYMELLEGLRTSINYNLVCKFTKSIHGLKQSYRAWYQQLISYLISQIFIKLDSNANIYR
jgi:hypothetical protein